jgi:hypothetical protein
VEHGDKQYLTVLTVGHAFTDNELPWIFCFAGLSTPDQTNPTTGKRQSKIGTVQLLTQKPILIIEIFPIYQDRLTCIGVV